jgi:hypothetical protein
MNVTELNPGTLTIAPLFLLKLMRDLALLEENTIGLPVSSYQVPLAERLCRVGVGDQKVEDFIAWRRSISSLIIVAVEAAGIGIRRTHRLYKKRRRSRSPAGSRGLDPRALHLLPGSALASEAAAGEAS